MKADCLFFGPQVESVMSGQLASSFGVLGGPLQSSEAVCFTHCTTELDKASLAKGIIKCVIWSLQCGCRGMISPANPAC